MKSHLTPPDLDKPTQERITTHLVKLPEAARIIGLPPSLLRKAFMREKKRPRNVPAPPPQKRIGRAIYILAERLSAWVESLDESKHANWRKKTNVALAHFAVSRGLPVIPAIKSPTRQAISQLVGTEMGIAREHRPAFAAHVQLSKKRRKRDPCLRSWLNLADCV